MTVVLFIEWLLIMFLHFIGWLHFCGILLFECISVCAHLYTLIQ